MKKKNRIFLVLGVLAIQAGAGSLTACSTKQTEEIVSIISEDTEAEGNEGKEETTDKQCPIIIHILGAVNSPGVYALEEGARVIDAISMAGGLSEEADEEWLNQARVLSDGEQIYVPTYEEAENMRKQGLEREEDDESAKDGKLNINKATLEDLMTLPGIGESKARSILNYREENGSFSDIKELMNIPGIKEGIYNQIKDLITI